MCVCVCARIRFESAWTCGSVCIYIEINIYNTSLYIALVLFILLLLWLLLLRLRQHQRWQQRRRLRRQRLCPKPLTLGAQPQGPNRRPAVLLVPDRGGRLGTGSRRQRESSDFCWPYCFDCFVQLVRNGLLGPDGFVGCAFRWHKGCFTQKTLAGWGNKQRKTRRGVWLVPLDYRNTSPSNGHSHSPSELLTARKVRTKRSCQTPCQRLWRTR